MESGLAGEPFGTLPVPRANDAGQSGRARRCVGKSVADSYFACLNTLDAGADDELAFFLPGYIPNSGRDRLYHRDYHLHRVLQYA